MAEYGAPSIDIETTAIHDFKNGEYCLSMSVESEGILRISVEDQSTGDSRSGKFDQTCELSILLVQ